MSDEKTTVGVVSTSAHHSRYLADVLASGGRVAACDEVKMSAPQTTQRPEKLMLEVNPDRFLKTCYRQDCGLDGPQKVDFTGFKDSPWDGRRLFAIECSVCERRFVGCLVEDSTDAK